MTGMHRATGRALDGIDHIRQSIADILTTPLGSRVMRRDYGSLLPELIDQPQNAATHLQLMAATVDALLRWEPRVRPVRVALFYGDTRGHAEADLDVELVGEQGAQNLRVPLHMRTPA